MWPNTRRNYPEPSVNRPGENPASSSFEVGFATDPGLSGKPNQDYYGIFETTYSIGENTQANLPILVIVIADGVSIASGSDIAGQLAVEIVRRVIIENEHVPIVARLEAAIVRANKDIHLLVQNDQQLEGAGTTIIISAIAEDQLFVARVGDSRAYLQRNRRLQMLTADHRWGQEAVDAGELTAEAAAQHPDRNIVSRLLGTDENVEVDHSLIDVSQGPFAPAEFFRWPRVDRMWLQAGDTLLLCSDGLSDVVPPEQIETTLNRTAPQQAATRLVELANIAGGPDNVTVIVVRLPQAENERATQQNWYQLQPQSAEPTHPSRQRQPLSLLRLLVAGWVILMIALGLGYALARWVLPALQSNQLPTATITATITIPLTTTITTTVGLTAPAPLPTLGVSDPITDTPEPVATKTAPIVTTVTTRQSVAPVPTTTIGASTAATHTETAQAANTPTLPSSPTLAVTALPESLTANATALFTVTTTPTISVLSIATAQPLITSTPNQAATSVTQANIEQTLLTAEPIKGIVHSSSVTFRWQPNFDLAEGQAYELIIWPAGQAREKSARAWGGISSETVRILNFDNLGISYGRYLWGVRLVQIEPYRVIEYLGPDYQIDYIP